MTPPVRAQDAVTKVLDDVAALPLFLAGSAAAAVCTSRDYAYHDVDLFSPSQGVYFSAVQQLLNRGYRLESDRFTRMWQRHLRYGFNAWHTNSMRLIDETTGTEVNVIYKRVDGHETTQLSQVLESFDFGILGVGYETDTGVFRDLRQYLFPDATDLNVLPMMGYRADNVGQGLMSQHTMLRMPGRYARYSRYGYDLSLVQPTLVRGYLNYAAYKEDRTKPEDQTLAQIAKALAFNIESNMLDELLSFEKQLPMQDGLDDILASIE